MRTRTTRCCASRPARTSPTHKHRHSVRRRPATTSSAHRRDVREVSSRRLAGGAATTPCWSRSLRDRSPSRFGKLHAALPGPRRLRPRSPGSARRSSSGCTAATPAASRTTARKQAEYEMERHHPHGVTPGYFLVVADFISWAKKQRHPRSVPAVAPAAGSIVAYAMGITDLDPLQHGLIFERFLNPERMSLPDVDIDFDERRRAEVIRYVTEKYGDDKVAYDRHVRQDQGEERHQGLRAGARLPASPWASGSPRRCRRRSWARTSTLNGIFDPSTRATAEAGEFREIVRERTRTCRRSSTPPRASRA